MTKRVVTKEGYQNLYKVIGSKKLEIIQVKVGIFSDKNVKIGAAGNLEDALSIIKSHSGSQIKEVKEW